ncbi:MAG: hypothetical protein WC554_04035 [Clostridia bacterium]|jgi:hypothetical protein
MVDEAQAIEGYGCSCGFMTDDKKTFRKHLLLNGQKEPGKHKSIGRINLMTKEVTMGPWVERTKEEKDLARYGKNHAATAAAAASKGTENFSEATEVRFVPRVYTAPFSNIMICAMEAAKREWKWRPDMPLINFIDTVVYNYFKEHGITLQTYTVNKHEPDPEEIDNEPVENTPEVAQGG